MPSSSPSEFLLNYKPSHDLPPLAGLGSFSDASQRGLSVEESVSRLKRHHYAFKRLHHLLIAHITAQPIYELKMAFSYHAYLCAEQTTAMRDRVGEMREPPLGLDRVPHPALELFFDEILCAPATELMLLGIYEVAVPALANALELHIKESHILADQPTRRACRSALGEIGELLDYGRFALRALLPANRSLEQTRFATRLRELLAIAGGIDGTEPELAEQAERHFSATPFKFDSKPKRDARFPDPYNMGINAEAFLYDAGMPADAKVLMMFYKRLREIDVPEMMASILTETERKPWDYYRDLTRQLWDEARHAMMGEVGFVSAGIDWPRLVMVNYTWSLALNTQLAPKERHAVLYYIEQGLMPKNGKRHEWEVSLASRNELASTFQDFDWADEVLHARFGRDWYVSDMPSPREAVSFGDQCWSKVLVNWEGYRESGLTDHHNWWEALYSEFCRLHKKTPDPAAAAFNQSYQHIRADLKEISASG
ncbi:MAG: hypothetical protein JWL90_105 [Chthoniobacteraceae bacterium]|nr:hypothetical protein [Chthoniobacteraceae bacterium]